MVVLPAGSFSMGSSSLSTSMPQHEVAIMAPFAVAKFELTFAEWDACASVGACPQAADSGKGRGNKPVINVSWNDAQKYVAWLSLMTGKSYRLLSEAEYEYAARGASTAARYAPLDQIAWYSANSMGTTHEVRRKRANGYGLYDMLRNLWVWTADWYGRYTGAEAADPKGPATGPAGVLRGGSWRNDGSRIRASARLTDGRANQFYEYGIRCAGN
jgi:formylglycine-generating enzyme required for sulfatase activity